VDLVQVLGVAEDMAVATLVDVVLGHEQAPSDENAVPYGLRSPQATSSSCELSGLQRRTEPEHFTSPGTTCPGSLGVPIGTEGAGLDPAPGLPSTRTS
jgi:hypothetical protein